MEAATRTRDGIVELVATALEAASSLEELVDCAHAAALLDDERLVRAVLERLDDEVDRAAAASGSWQAELTYNKVDGWAQTGRRARLLAEAWAAVRPVLRAKRSRAAASAGR